jgi:nuclear pore complex protein Nup98-Nup96
MALSHKLLQHHLTNTNIILDDGGVPGASPEPLPSMSMDSARSPSTIKSLDFASFASIFSSTDSSGTASLFRLGVSLFDPLDLHLDGQHSPPSFTAPPIITPDIRNCVVSLRRKAALGQWLEEVSKPAIDSDLRSKANGLASGGMFYLFYVFHI